jgi:hypothetical protein
MSIKIYPSIYLFDIERKLFKTKKLKICRENIYQDKKHYGRPMMLSLSLIETSLEESEFWLIDLMIKIGTKFFHPLLFSVQKANSKYKLSDCLDGYIHYEINNNFLKNLQVDIDLKKITDLIPHYCFNSKQKPEKIFELYKKYCLITFEFIESKILN